MNLLTPISNVFRSSGMGYTLLPGHARDGEGVRVQLRLNRLTEYLSSRRLRLGAIAVSVACLLLLVHFFLPYYKSRTTRPNGSQSPSVPLGDGIDWTRFAYVQYATNSAYLCNSVMLFETLHRLGTKADRLLMYPRKFHIDQTDTDAGSVEGRLLQRAQDEYGVKLQPVEVQHKDSSDPTWAESFTKLLAFNQTQYDRVLSLDSDATVLQTMDELFTIPPAPVAMPRAYWLDFKQRTLSSQLILLQPSQLEYARIAKAINEEASGYDMEIMNTLYRDSCFVLPHRPYDLLTGEFRSDKHADYLGSKEEVWDPDEVFKEAKFLHFSDWPVPKPWFKAPPATILEHQPQCKNNGTCRERELWRGFYTDFAKRREEICGMQLLDRKRDLQPRHPSAWEYRR